MHVLDLSKQTTDDILADYHQINKELTLYGKNLAAKPQLLAGNKIDTYGAQEKIDLLRKALDKDIIAVSAKDGTGLDKLLKGVVEKLAGEYKNE